MKSKYKYVMHDPEGAAGAARTDRTKAQMGRWVKQPWIGKPLINKFFGGNVSTMSGFKRFATEREAAIWVDKWMLEHGKQPVNILKAKV